MSEATCGPVNEPKRHRPDNNIGWEDLMMRWTCAAALAGLLLTHAAGAARAEVGELRMATQFGIGAMPMIVMQHNKVLERHLAAAGLPDTKVSCSQFLGGNRVQPGITWGR